MTKLKLFIFQDPGLYYGAEFIPVVADNEDAAYCHLTRYLKRAGREKDIIRIHKYRKGDTDLKVEKTWEIAECCGQGQDGRAVIDLPTEAGVLIDLILLELE